MHEVGAKTSPDSQPDPLDVALREIDVAIELVVVRPRQGRPAHGPRGRGARRRPGPRPGPGGRRQLRTATIQLRRGRGQPAHRTASRWLRPHRPAVREPAGDRRASAAQGSQVRGSTRPRRAAALAVLPLRGAGRPGGARGCLDAADAGPAGRSRACARSSSDGPSRTRRRSASACRRRRPSRSSAPTPSARPRTRPRRSCASSSSPAPRPCSSRSRCRSRSRVLLAVVSVSYRQVCRAYPNGGGAYVVARTNLAPIFGLIAAAALLIDYVMTVAVSTASAIAQIQSVFPAAYDVRIEIAFVSIALITIANLRGLRESGNIFAVPTYLFVGLALAIVGIGAVRIVTGHSGPGPARARRPGVRDRGAGDPVAAQGLRRRLGRADRRRGDRQRRPRVQAARSEERGEHDDGHGDPARHPLRRADGRRGRLRPAPDRRGRQVDRRARGGGHLRRRLAARLHVRGKHGADPVPRREHELQRLPTPGRDPVRGRVHAPPVLLPRRSAGVLVGDRAARRDRVRDPVGLRWRHPRADPALLGRRVPVLHPQPDRDGQALATGPGAGLALAPRRQCRWAAC